MKKLKIIFYIYFLIAFSYLVWQVGRSYGYKEGYRKAEVDNNPIRQEEKYCDLQYRILNDLLGREYIYSSKIKDILVHLKRVKK